MIKIEKSIIHMFVAYFYKSIKKQFLQIQK